MDQKTIDVEALFFEGTHEMASGDLARAEKSFRLALEIAPDFAEVHANLGLLMDRSGHQEAAESSYRRSIELNPEPAQPYLNLGVLMVRQKRFLEAELAYAQAIARDPDSPVGWSNRGVLYACMKREAEAEQSYRTALALDADYALARFNLSYLLLRQGRFEEGWSCLEARNWYGGLAAQMTCPRWQGESLVGQSILLSYEAGHGDVIQFCRYAAVLKGMGAAAITLICHPALKTLLAALKDVDTVISFHESLPPSGFDFWTPLLSVPNYCQTRMESIPATIPYIEVPAERIVQWATLLPESGIRIGLVWRGNAQFENDADRSLPSLDVLLPLWAVAGVHFISLQKGAGEAEAAQPPHGLPLLNLGPMFEDFADAAAAIMNLDLVITVDTATAHLAGALGKRCWVLLPSYKTDWRWLTERTDSPWYPDLMRLFRQTTMGDWRPVVAEIAAALHQFVQQNSC